MIQTESVGDPKVRQRSILEVLFDVPYRMRDTTLIYTDCVKTVRVVT